MATANELSKGIKISFKGRHGELLKGVVKRLTPDETTVIINGEDGSRYSRSVEDVLVLGGKKDDIDTLVAKAPVDRNAPPPPSDKLKDFDINKRFDFLSQLTRMVVNGTAVSLIITGEGGLGKTYTALKEIMRKQLVKDKDWFHIKGFSTPRGLYRILFENNGKLIVFDDCDEVIEDKVASNLLKGALDSYDEREIHWITKTSDESLPDSFNFDGRVIFISNLPKEKVPQALLSRAMNIDISMTRQEKIDRMQWIVDYSKDFMPLYPTAQKQECLDIIKQYVDEVRELSLRSLEKVIKIRAGEKDMLDPNDPDFANMDWTELAKFMLLS